MSKTVISADSVSLPLPKAREHGFTLIPCPIAMDRKQYLDTELDMESLYERLDTRQNLPKTSAVNVDRFLEHFLQTGTVADSILHIAMSSVFSPQYSHALKASELARDKLPDKRIEVIDSRTIGIGVHLIAIIAGEAARKGKKLDEIIDVINNTLPGLRELTARDTLFYYDKGGRIFEARSWAEAEVATSFRSIIEVDPRTEGAVKPVARARTIAQIISRLVEITRETCSGELKGAIGYTRGAVERAEMLRETLVNELQFGWLHIAEESASVAIHNGRGCISYAFCSQRAGSRNSVFKEIF